MNKKQLLRAKKREIATTGRLLFSAFFGEPKAFERQVEAEFGDEPNEPHEHEDRSATLAAGYSFVRCASCAREQPVAVDVDVRSLEAVGWRLVAGAWRCPFCKDR